MFSAEETRQLDGLTFGAPTASPAATLAGGRVARARGHGGEVHDVRHYEPGDDPRSIEWTIYARLNQLVTRTYRANAHLRIHLLLDISRSMSIGSPEKLSCATRVAAALAYVGIHERDAVGVAMFDDRIADRIVPAFGRLQLLRTLSVLSEASARGPSAIGRALMDYGAAERGPGLAVVLSDFFDSTGVLQGLRYLLHRGLTPAVVQIVSPDELDPMITGDVELVDIEDGESAPLLVDGETVAAYRQALAEHRDSLGEFCRTHGLPWMQIVSSASFSAVLRALHGAGLLTVRG